MFKKNSFTLIIGLFCFSPLSIGASFDCSKAVTLIEKTVCTNKQLSDLDSLVSSAYKTVLNVTTNPNEIKNRQLDWLLTERNQCQDIACLKSAYVSRLAELNNKKIMKIYLVRKMAKLLFLKTRNGSLRVLNHTFQMDVVIQQTCILKVQL